VSDTPFTGFSGPLYDQVHKHLRSRILAGEWEHWQPLPPEVSLSQELGVSVGTVRKAMEKLMQERIVVRERGRGTFVRRDSSERSVSMLAIRNRDGEVVEPEKSTAHYSETRVSGPAARTLVPKLGPSVSLPAIIFERDWTIDGFLICHETILIHQKQFPVSPETRELSGDEILASYMEHYRTQFRAARWEIGAQPILAPVSVLEAFQQPLIVVTRHSLNENVDRIEVCEHIVSLASHSFEIVQ
jgi:DNA-binding GntR family transcriptional regulator